MKILLTGANGLIGQKILHCITGEENVQVIATSKIASRIDLHQNFVFETLDITDKKTGEKIFEKYEPNIIINCAAMTQADECENDRKKCREVNIAGVRKLLELAADNKSFFLQLSTDFVFNGKNGPYKEEDPPDPVSYYGNTKWEAEKLIRNSGLSYAIVRTILVYGFLKSASRKNLVTWVLESLKNGQKIKVVSDQIRTPALAEDVASGCISILKNRHEGIFHIGGKDTMSPYDMAIQTANFFNLDVSLIERVSTSFFPQPAKRPLITGLCIDKAKKELNYKPHSFQEGLMIIKSQLEKNQRQ